MKRIPKKPYPGATPLKPLEMNKIPFSIGRHSTLAQK